MTPREAKAIRAEHQPHCVVMRRLSDVLFDSPHAGMALASEQERWLRDNVGSGGYGEDLYSTEWAWMRLGVAYYFKDKDAAFHFKMRWA